MSDPSHDPTLGLGAPFHEKSLTTTTSGTGPSQSPPSPPVDSSRANRDADELVTKKKHLVEAFSQLVAPLDAILAILRWATTFAVLLLALLAIMVGVQVHTTLKLAEIIEAQKALQQATTQVAANQTSAATLLANQSQITIEPSMGPDGSTTAIVVVKPPPAAPSSVPAVPLIVSPIPHSSKGASSARPPMPPPPEAVVPQIQFQ